ncbi:YkvI family membrane protein [Dermatophilus congolensis]|uniref:Uncharacterized membrane protein n=2 Tax=Dermatophilus congolensis TaxID=1863 RepID=A0A239V2T9_9MICO|nr:membrane protein [Dermatophilus congolensis]SNV16565.1 Uncharacterized membrane protein [Dermatophilus congolensis]
MSPSTTVKIALAFVGLLIGAGFATGQEVIQYFVSFGLTGLWGAVLSGVLMTVMGAVIIQLGSYFLAREHNMVFRNVAHPIVSAALDGAVTLTLFAVGFVMLAGAGSTLEQQFSLPSWVGAGVMLLLVMATGMLDVDKVSGIISGITPLIIVAVVIAFCYTMFHMPADVWALQDVALSTESPVQPWWLASLNYTGLALMLGVSMCLVIGGNYPNPREAGWGGLAGGAAYMVLLLMAAIVLYLNIARVGSADVPMLRLFEEIHPAFAYIMVFVVFAMIYNTAIGMFYALGRRLTASCPERYRIVFLATCVVGYGVSFVGFSTLMNYVYPVIGYIGLAMIAVMLVAWIRSRTPIREETGRRHRIKALLTSRAHPKRRFGRTEAAALRTAARESNVPDEVIVEVLDREAVTAVQEGEAEPTKSLQP